MECVTEEMVRGQAKPSFLATQLEVLQREGPKSPTNTEQIKAAAGVIYIAGAETTSSTLSFFFLAMVLYPECQIKAQEEIDAVIGRDRLPEFHDREHLPYVECLLQETLRWNHAAPSGLLPDILIDWSTDDSGQAYLIVRWTMMFTTACSYPRVPL